MEQEVIELLNKVLKNGSKVICPLMGGMMNRSFIVTNKKEEKFVLYLPTPQANELVNRKVEKENHFLTYELGLTNENIYFDINTGIKINRYIEGNSLDKVDEFDYQKVATLFLKLHNSKKLSSLDYHPFIRFIEYENTAKKYISSFENEYNLLREVIFTNKNYLENQPLTLCHNDSQKSNIIKDLNNNYYLIDFEFMANNDPIYDIAAFGNNNVSEGRKLLDYYFSSPNKEEIKRFYLWRIFISLQWHNVAITKHYCGEGKTHGYDFLKVAQFFLNNAKEAYQLLNKEMN